MLTPSGNVHEMLRDVSDEETSETVTLISRKQRINTAHYTLLARPLTFCLLNIWVTVLSSTSTVDRCHNNGVGSGGIETSDGGFRSSNI